MGLCSKLTLFAKVNGWKVANGVNVKKNKRVNWRNSEEKTRIIRRTTEKIKIEWIGKKAYWNTKIIIESRNLKEIKRRISWTLKIINREK